MGAASRAVRGLRCVATHFPGRAGWTGDGRSPPSSGTTGRASWPACRRTAGFDPTSRDRRVPSGDGESVTFRIDSAPAPSSPTDAASWASPSSWRCKPPSRWCCTRPEAAWTSHWARPVAGRTEAELDQLIGFFVNILVLRNDLRGNPTLRDVLSRARETALAAYAHQDLPFDRVVDSVSPMRSLSRNPLFQVIVHVRDHLPASRVIESASTAARTPSAPRWTRFSTWRTPTSASTSSAPTDPTTPASITAT